MQKVTLGILAHVDSGKTTLSEGLLYASGALRKLGRVDHGDAFLDTDALERERGITIFAKQAVLDCGGTKRTICAACFPIAKEHGVLFHTDAVQAYAQVPINVDEMHIDMLSASGHKLNGPKGIGFLYIRKGVKIRSFVHGGAQERSRRAGTENIPGIVGLGAAVERAMRIMDTKTRKEIELRDYLIGRLENEIPHCWLNGHRTKRLPNNINFSFLFIEGESMLIMLDMKGICASSGSACTSGSLDPSHVLLAIGLKHEEAHGSLRLTLSEESTKEEMDIVAEEVKKIVQRLRDMSPLYEDFLKSQKNN